MTEHNIQPTGTKKGLLVSFGIGLGVMFGRILESEDWLWETEHWITVVRGYVASCCGRYFLA